jgi:hypothetical protein
MGPRTATAGSPAKAGALLVCLALVPRAGIATDTFSLGLDVGVGASDNIYELQSPKTSEIMPTAGFDIALHREGTVVDADLTGLFSYYDYVHRSYSNDVYGRSDGLVKLSLVPERIVWVVQEDFGQAALNLFQPQTPGNLEYVNFISTGPDFSLRLGERGFLRLGARYANVHYQTSPFDSNRASENVALGRELSANSDVSLNVDAEQIRFKDTTQPIFVDGLPFPPNSNFDRREAYLRYEARGARTTLSANAGVSESDESVGWHSKALLALSLARTLGPHTTLTLSAGQQLTDAADDFRDLQAGAAGGIVIAPVAGYGSYVARYVSGGWRLERDRTTIALSDRYEDDSYVAASLLNAKRNDLELNVGRRLTPAVGVQLVGSLRHSSYYNQDFDSNDHRVGAALVMQPARKLEIRFLYDHLWRTAAGPGSSTFEENRVFLLLTYRPVGAAEQVNPTGLPLPSAMPVPGRLVP